MNATDYTGHNLSEGTSISEFRIRHHRSSFRREARCSLAHEVSQPPPTCSNRGAARLSVANLVAIILPSRKNSLYDLMNLD